MFYYESIKITLFYTNFGFNVNIFKNINKKGPNNIKAILISEQLKELHKNIKKKT